MVRPQCPLDPKEPTIAVLGVGDEREEEPEDDVIGLVEPAGDLFEFVLGGLE
jgi:hypothetical protein